MTSETRTAPQKVWMSTLGTIHAAMKSDAAATSHESSRRNGRIFGRTSLRRGGCWYSEDVLPDMGR